MIVKGGFVHVAFALIKRITIEYDYKATVIQKAFAFKTISFERAAK